MCVKKEIPTVHGLFKIGTTEENNCDFVLSFAKKGAGIHRGKRHFSSLDEAENFVLSCDVGGFKISDL